MQMNLGILLVVIAVGSPQSQSASARIVEGAKIQAREAATYTPGYFKIGYPQGDLNRNKGVCTDVVIRALRHAGFDLQKMIHDDMQARFKTYPRRERRPDSNIDHRRCPNQMHYFRKFGKTLTNRVEQATLKHWQPGDIVYWKLDSGLDHTGILSNVRNGRGIPLVVHNLGRCAEEDVLTQWKIVGHFRFPK